MARIQSASSPALSISPAKLREQAQRARRLANAQTQTAEAELLRQIAAELEARAATLEPQAARPGTDEAGGDGI